MTDINRLVLLRQAHSFLESRQLLDTQHICHELLRRDKNDGDALLLLAETSWRTLDYSGAIKKTERYIKIFPNDPAGYLRLAVYYNRRGRYREARLQLKKLLKLHPNHPDAIATLVSTYDLSGDSKAATEILEPFIESKTETAAMAYQYATIQYDAKNHQKALEVALRHAGNRSLPIRVLEGLWFLLGKTYERLEDYDKAFEAYSIANSFVNSQQDIATRIAYYQSTIETFSPEALKKLPRARNASRLPMFILCRPRSGSTLIERIIAAHPQVHAAGEREATLNLRRDLSLQVGSSLPFPQCVQDMDQQDADSLADAFLKDLHRLAPHAKRITDKAVELWEIAGLLALLFPKAVFIDLRRDPVDNCLACWTVPLGENNLFTSDLRALGTIHKQYERLMEHWHAVLDVPILRVNYEDLVEDQETWTRRIIEFCGLEWDERCLRFYDPKSVAGTSTAGPTLSFQQVRKPIYKSSVARAKKFEKYLGPLLEALSDGQPENRTPIKSDDNGKNEMGTGRRSVELAGEPHETRP